MYVHLDPANLYTNECVLFVHQSHQLNRFNFHSSLIFTKYIFQSVSSDLRKLVQSSGFEFKEHLSSTINMDTLVRSNQVNVLKAVLLSGMYPQLAQYQHQSKVLIV